MSSIIPLDVVILCIQSIIFNVFKKKKKIRTSTSRAHRNNNNSCNNISCIFFSLRVLSIYVNTILHTTTIIIIIIIRIIIIMLYNNYNNFLSKKNGDKPIYA